MVNPEEYGVPEKRRTIRYDEEEAGARTAGPVPFGQPLSRTNTNASGISTRSMQPRARSVDPAIALPIEYRTLSFNITHTREKEVVEAKDIREKAAKGQYHTVP